MAAIVSYVYYLFFFYIPVRETIYSTHALVYTMCVCVYGRYSLFGEFDVTHNSDGNTRGELVWSPSN